jgi:hypothetical protein
MRWRGVSHVEFAVLDYDNSITFCDALFGWLGSDSFSSLNWSTSRSTTSPDTSTRTATLAFSRPDRGKARTQRPGGRRQSHCAVGP